MSNAMFCYQCQEAARGLGCNVRGMRQNRRRGQSARPLIYLMKGIAAANIKAKEIQQDEDAAVEFIVDGLFATITNANFDRDYFLAKIAQGLALRQT